MILIVEDNDLITDWLRSVIQDAGYYFDAASDATLALYKIEHLDYALILIDIGLPDHPGDVLAEHIKRLPPPAGTTPLIAITGGPGLSQDRRDLFYDVLTKPFLPDALRAAIQKHARPPIRDLHLTRAVNKRESGT